MKFFAALCFTLPLIAASPVAFKPRQVGIISDDLENGGPNCPGAILIFARASTEVGNMGETTGPALANTLAPQVEGGLWVQGVGGPYTADLASNFLPKGTSQEAIDEGKRLLALANSKCPATPVVAGGYSQGTALMAAALTESPDVIRNQVQGVVLFGYTRNQQNGGGIPDFPQSKLEVYCADGDLVCDGTLVITPAHLTYVDEASNEAPAFLLSKLDGQ